MNPTAQSQMLLIGRILLGVLFLVAGIRKIMFYAGSAAYFTKLGFPAPEVMAVLAILIEIGGAALLILGWQTRRISWLLILFVAIATAMAHRFWEFDAPQYANQMNHFLKNAAIVGGLLYVAVLGAGALSMDGKSTQPS
ncbi:MAG TPA: DoxX family protein [Burkholderiales bacterium]|nr:DoxX family protein [Burkholderiales bacterium]